MSFNNDIQTGQEGENIFVRYLQSDAKKLLHSITFNNDSRYDIMGKDDEGKSYTFEVKYDTYKSTGNMAIELFCRQREKPSGLFITQADYFVYIFKLGNAYLAKTSLWKDIVKELPVNRITGGGDKGHAVLALVPLEDYKDRLKEIHL